MLLFTSVWTLSTMILWAEYENLSTIRSLSVDWFDVQTGLTYSLGSDAAYDQAVVYYTCYLGSIVESGMGISQIRLADVDVKYINAEFANFVELALELLAMKLNSWS